MSLDKFIPKERRFHTWARVWWKYTRLAACRASACKNARYAKFYKNQIHINFSFFRLPKNQMHVFWAFRCLQNKRNKLVYRYSNFFSFLKNQIHLFEFFSACNKIHVLGGFSACKTLHTYFWAILAYKKIRIIFFEFFQLAKKWNSIECGYSMAMD